MATVLLNLVDVSFTYIDNKIIHELNWEIQAGQKIGLVGANGSGKSTVLKLILGRLNPESGTIFRSQGPHHWLPAAGSRARPGAERAGGGPFGLSRDHAGTQRTGPA